MTFQGHPEAKTKMAANIQHEIIISQPVTILSILFSNDSSRISLYTLFCTNLRS